jgi:hypothetical protein
LARFVPSRYGRIDMVQMMKLGVLQQGPSVMFPGGKTRITSW